MIELLPRRWQRKIQYALNLHAPHLGACWEMTSKWNSGNGYKKVRVKGKSMVSHRATFEHVHERPVDKGKVLDHLCRNRACCNPTHVEEVTPRANTERGLGVLYQFRRAA